MFVWKRGARVRVPFSALRGEAEIKCAHPRALSAQALAESAPISFRRYWELFRLPASSSLGLSQAICQQ